jgi:hypothetical protein
VPSPAISSLDFGSAPGFGSRGRARFPVFHSQFSDSCTDFSLSRWRAGRSSIPVGFGFAPHVSPLSCALSSLHLATASFRRHVLLLFHLLQCRLQQNHFFAPCLICALISRRRNPVPASEPPGAGPISVSRARACRLIRFGCSIFPHRCTVSP